MVAGSVRVVPEGSEKRMPSGMSGDIPIYDGLLD